MERHGVIDDVPLVIQQVTRSLTLWKPLYVVGHEATETIFGARSADDQVAHMGHVEKASRLAHRPVLFQDGRVLYRHLPSGEIHKACAKGDVGRMEGSSVHCPPVAQGIAKIICSVRKR